MGRLYQWNLVKGGRGNMDKEVTDVPSAEEMARLRSRKDSLKMIRAAGLGASVGSNVYPA